MLPTEFGTVLSRTCVLMMGATGSGKSTLAEYLAAAPGAAIVSYDSHPAPPRSRHGCRRTGE